jgi:hypothetical protein
MRVLFRHAHQAGLLTDLAKFVPAEAYVTAFRGSREMKTVALLAIAGIAAAASADFTVSDAGPFNSNGPVGNAVNGVYTFTAGHSGAFTGIRIQGTATSGGIGSYKNELRYRLTADGGANRDSGALASGNTWTGGFAVDNTQVFSSFNLTGGNSYSIRFWESFDDGGTTGVDAIWSNVSFTFTGPVPPGPGDNQALAIDLGTLGNGITSVSSALNSATTNLKWYKFTLDAGSTFLDGWTSGTALDTEIGLYDAAGNLVGTNDDGNFGLLSALRYGAGSPLTTGADIEAAAGADGAVPAAGVYYMAVGGYNSVFGATGFNVTAGAATGTFTLNLIPTPGSLALLGLGGLAAARRRR